MGHVGGGREDHGAEGALHALGAVAQLTSSCNLLLHARVAAATGRLSELGKCLDHWSVIRVNYHLGMRKRRTSWPIGSISFIISTISGFWSNIIFSLHHAGYVRSRYNTGRFHPIHCVVITIITKVYFTSVSVGDHLTFRTQLCPTNNTNVKILLRTATGILILTNSNKVILENIFGFY